MTEALVDVVVYGEAVPAGALAAGFRGDGRVFLRHRGGAELDSWKRSIKDAAGTAMEGRAPTRDAVYVSLRFLAKRPAGHYGKRGLRPSAPKFPTKRSVADADKLTRAVLDALTGIVYADDSQVVEMVVSRYYADGSPVRCEIVVRGVE